MNTAIIIATIFALYATTAQGQNTIMGGASV